MYVLGKLLSTADTLPRSPVCCVESFDDHLLCEVENHVDYVIAYLPASNNLLQKIRNKFVSDHVCSQVIIFCQNGWPSQARFGHDLHPYFQVRNDISFQKRLLLKCDGIVIPMILKKKF